MVVDAEYRAVVAVAPLLQLKPVLYVRAGIDKRMGNTE